MSRRRSISPVSHRRAYTLLEAMMASGLLFAVVLAITAAMTAGQQHSHEAQLRTSGALAAEDLMGQLIDVPYASLSSWDGFTEDVGSVQTGAAAHPLPLVGRRCVVRSASQNIPNPALTITGVNVTVESFGPDGGVLVELERFVPEPRS